jgi:hypothetical protein
VQQFDLRPMGPAKLLGPAFQRFDVRLGDRLRRTARLVRANRFVMPKTAPS